jgi:hypothetical protein
MMPFVSKIPRGDAPIGAAPADFMTASRKPVHSSLQESLSCLPDSILGHTAAHGVTQKPTSPINQHFRYI